MLKPFQAGSHSAVPLIVVVICPISDKLNAAKIWMSEPLVVHGVAENAAALMRRPDKFSCIQPRCFGQIQHHYKVES